MNGVSVALTSLDDYSLVFDLLNLSLKTVLMTTMAMPLRLQSRLLVLPVYAVCRGKCNVHTFP